MPSYTKEDIRAMLDKNDMAVVRGVEAIYARQTADEQSAETTSYRNGVGFNGRDAGILSSFANQIADWRAEKANTGRNRYQFPLSPKQLAIARRSILKYAGQLAAVANAKAGVITEAQEKAARVDAAFQRVSAVADEVQAEREAAAELVAERAAIQAVEAEDEYDFGSAPAEDELVEKGSTIRQYASERDLAAHEVRLSGVVEFEDEYLSLA